MGSPKRWVVDLVDTESCLHGEISTYSARTLVNLPDPAGCNVDRGACDHTGEAVVSVDHDFSDSVELTFRLDVWQLRQLCVVRFRLLFLIKREIRA